MEYHRGNSHMAWVIVQNLMDPNKSVIPYGAWVSIEIMDKPYGGRKIVQNWFDWEEAFDNVVAVWAEHRNPVYHQLVSNDGTVIPFLMLQP